MAPGCFSMTQQQQQQQTPHDNKQDSTLDKLNTNLEHLNENEFYLDLSSNTQSSHELACSSETNTFKTNLNANSSCSFVYEYNLDQIPLPDGMPPAKFAWQQLESQEELTPLQLNLEDQRLQVDSIQLINSQELLGNVPVVQASTTTNQTANSCMEELLTFASEPATTVTSTTNEFPLINSSYVSFNNNNNNYNNQLNSTMNDKPLVSTFSTSFGTNYPGYNMHDTIDSFEILEQTIMKQKRLARTKNADLRKKILLKRTFDLVCEIVDQENGIYDDLDEETSKSIEKNEVKNKSKTDESFRKKDQENSSSSSDEEDSDEDDDDSSSDSDSSNSSDSSESEESGSDEDDDDDDDDDEEDDLYNRRKKKLKSFHHSTPSNTFEIKCKNEHDLLNTKTILVKLENLNESDLLVSADNDHHQIVHLQSNATPVSSVCNQPSNGEHKQHLSKLKRRRHSNSDEDDDDEEEEESDDETTNADYDMSSLHTKSTLTSSTSTRTSINLRYKKFKL